ncbi:DUF5996 family protein [Mucilaginibacter aquaedulcis]|uniref:DUF5996 family protein n=1 Tax=Mucilaginibacter aquaedulcis TaxID=1187081 RepID=UPI0025B4964E|nr:DUF5996 family protein [Mucilaginibacter aquaedulcis]MDN3547657.1 DUF5996 family protein [Mucilaginibacter aquaedulcis]
MNWPELRYQDLKDTVATVHLWTQIVGKIRLVKMPWLNHSWHVTLYVSPTGLTTGSIPYDGGLFQIDFDFVSHQLTITSSAAPKQQMRLYQRSVASFYKELLEKLAIMNINVEIYARPNEIPVAIPFAEDETHFIYEPEQINLFWQALVKAEAVFTLFRAKFYGKCSPVHFFWGGFDLAVTRFSGREAPKHPGGAPNMSLEVMQEAYSHEVSSCGFWPGSDSFPHPSFYSYCYPTPNNFKDQPVMPEQAQYNEAIGEFILTYDDVRKAADPESSLLQFLQSTYDAAANTGKWPRKALECDLSGLEP